MTRIFVLFFLSGFSGLVYEVVWLRLLTLSFGCTLPAVSTVLSAFMAGMGIGALLAGRIGDNLRNPFRTYCLIEAAIAVLGVCLTIAFFHLEGIARLLDLVSGGSAGLLIAGRVVVTFLLLLGPTLLMGATLPILTSALIKIEPEISSVVSKLYGFNTTGAVLGCLAADLLLIPNFGVMESGFFAAAVNLVVAIIGLRIGAVTPARTLTAEPVKSYEQQPPSPVEKGRLWIALAALSGASGLALEVILTRVLLYFTGSRIYAFSAMLAVFLLGLALGSLYLCPVLIPKRKSVEKLKTRIAIVMAATGAAVILAIFSLSILKTFMTALRFLIPGSSFGFYTPAQSLAASFIVMFPPTVGLGALFPMIIRAYRISASGPGSAVGGVYFWNTIGCITGSFLGGFVILPFLGSQHGLAATGSLLAVVGIVLLFKDVYRKPAAGAAMALLVGATVCVAWIMPSDFLSKSTYHEAALKGDDRLIYFKEGVNETLAVTEEYTLGRPMLRRLITNRTSMSTTSLQAQRYMKLMAHLPAILGKKPENALLICYGVGNTLNGLTRYKSIEKIWVVDISKDIISLSPLFRKTNHDAISDPRVETVIEDGRHFLVTTNHSFDIITAEPPPPAARGVVNLYSREYYRLVKSRLSPGGFFTQWLPVEQMPPWETRTLIKAFLEVFPRATLWSGAGSNLILMGGKEPLRINLPNAAMRAKEPDVQKDIASIGLQNEYDLLALLSADHTELEKITGNAPACSDNNPYIEYADFNKMDYSYITQLSRLQGNPAGLVADWGAKEDEKEKRRLLARQISFERQLKKMAVAFEKTEKGGKIVRSIFLNPPPLTVLPDTPYLRAILDVQKELLPAAEKRLVQNPEDAHAKFMLARNAYYTGEMEKASKMLDQLAETHGDYEKVNTYRMYAYRLLGKNEEADRLAKKLGKIK